MKVWVVWNVVQDEAIYGVYEHKDKAEECARRHNGHVLEFNMGVCVADPPGECPHAMVPYIPGVSPMPLVNNSRMFLVRSDDGDSYFRDKFIAKRHFKKMQNDGKSPVMWAVPSAHMPVNQQPEVDPGPGSYREGAVSGGLPSLGKHH